MKTARLLSFVLLAAFASVVSADLVRLGNDVVPTAEAVMLTTDPRSDDYSGSVVVDLQVKKATPTFRFHAEDMTVTALKLMKGASAVEVTHAKGDDGTVLVTAAKPLQPGKYTLAHRLHQQIQPPGRRSVQDDRRRTGRRISSRSSRPSTRAGRFRAGTSRASRSRTS